MHLITTYESFGIVNIKRLCKFKEKNTEDSAFIIDRTRNLVSEGSMFDSGSTTDQMRAI